MEKQQERDREWLNIKSDCFVLHTDKRKFANDASTVNSKQYNEINQLSSTKRREKKNLWAWSLLMTIGKKKDRATRKIYSNLLAVRNMRCRLCFKFHVSGSHESILWFVPNSWIQFSRFCAKQQVWQVHYERLRALARMGPVYKHLACGEKKRKKKRNEFSEKETKVRMMCIPCDSDILLIIRFNKLLFCFV